MANVVVKCLELKPVRRFLVRWTDGDSAGDVVTGGEEAIRRVLAVRGLTPAEIDCHLADALTQAIEAGRDALQRQRRVTISPP
jgi:hypothetical protein